MRAKKKPPTAAPPPSTNRPGNGTQRSQRIHFTPLPNGAEEGQQRLSVMVTPQLRTRLGNAKLASFAPWTQWPTVLVGLGWRVGIRYQDTVKGEPQEVTVEAKRVGNDPRPDLWARLFAPGLPVVSYKPPAILDKEVLDFDSKAINDYLGDKLAGHVQTPGPPNQEEILKSYAAINVLDSTAAGVTAKIEGILQSLDKNGFVSRQNVGIQRAALQMLAFNAPAIAPLKQTVSQRRRAFRKAKPPLVAADLLKATRIDRPLRPVKPTFDFHAVVGALGSHPQLLRKLGLVFELEFAPPSGRPIDRVWVEPVGSFGTGIPKVFPSARITALCVPGAPALEARPSNFAVDPKGQSGPPGEIKDGMLALEEPAYSLRQIEPEQLALKTMSAAAAVAKRTNGVGRAAASVLRARSVEPPPLPRSSGLSVVREERGKVLTHRFARQLYVAAYLDSSTKDGEVAFYREDLTRGYAFDVFDAQSNRWYSLCKRQGSAVFADGFEETLVEEEGWVGGGVTQAKALGDVTVRATEPIARWSHSWSLVTPRPGKAMGLDETPTDEQGANELGVRVAYTTPAGTLPPQRFGRSYRVRARAVDLAGNVTSTEAADATGTKHTLGLETLVRHEPVPPPVVAMRDVVTEGESVDVAVIRSEGGLSGAREDRVAQRHLLPPAIDPWGAEQHSVFDRADGPLASFWEVIAARADGKLDERTAGGDYKHAGAKADPNNLGQPFFDVDEPRFEVEQGKLARVPWLPDPAAVGILLRNLPGEDFTENFLRPGAVWPDVQPLLLRLVHSTGYVKPQLKASKGGDGAPHVLEVGLPPAEDRIVEVSSVPPPDVTPLGAWATLNRFGKASGAELSRLAAAMLAGRHWAVSPARRLRVVHAVRVPLRAAAFTSNLSLPRKAGESSVRVSDNMVVDRASTERFEVTANWYEKRDYLPTGAAADDTEAWQPEQLVPVSGLAFQRKLDRTSGPNDRVQVNEPHELNHLRHIPQIAYSTEATSRFTEYFVETDKKLKVLAGKPVKIDGRGIVANSDIVSTSFAVTSALGVVQGQKARKGKKLPEFATRPDGPRAVPARPGSRTLRRGEDYAIDYRNGAITGLNGFSGDVTVQYLPFPSSIRSPAPVVRRAVSAARPVAPKVLYAVPTFRREEVRRGTRLRHTHEPVGLRVYLDRPWWSSGDEEQLGVVCLDRREEVTPDIEKFVSQRGQDPIWGSAPTTRPVKTGMLTAGSARGALTLPEAPEGSLFAVSGHKVSPDRSRRLWYADVDISPGSAYTPFVRLALARYQPFSVKGLELSPVVLLDFMQLYPSRTATVARSGDTVTVSVSGRSYDTPSGDRKAYFTLELERRRQGFSGDDSVGWEVVQPVGIRALETVLDGKSGLTGITTWAGSVTRPPGRDRHRIVLREFEVFAEASGTRPRLVFSEVIEL